MPKILAIDDKQDNLVSISALLKNLIPDSTVTTAQTGAEGIERARIECPDTILLDIKMPEMDGFEVCRILKSSEETKQIPVIMLTAMGADSESRVKGLELGADAFLTKPIENAELAAQVNAMLRLKKAEDTLRKEKDHLEDLVRERTKELRAAEKKYRAIFDNAIEGIYQSTPGGSLISANPALARIFGYESPEDMIKNLTDIETQFYAEPKSRKRLLRMLHRNEVVKGFEVEICRKDGGIAMISENARAVRDSNGDVLYFEGTVEDITDRKRAEEEKRKLQAQLQRSQKMEAIGALAGGIAHDFNNILTPLMLRTEMAMSDLPKESPVQRHLEEVLRAGDRARDLVRQILTFSSQKEQGRKPLRISLIVKEALKLLRASLPKTIEIRQKIKSDSGTILADPSQIHQVLMNLCTNGAHAMREKGGVLEVSLIEESLDSEAATLIHDLRPGPYLRLTVRDTGHGMDKEVVERIFEPYFSTKEKDEGTGLGLSMVHGIVTSYGGTITVDSEPWKGSSFDLYFPRIASGVLSEIQPAGPLPGGTERILFIDDEKVVVDTAQQMLEQLGYKVVTKTSGVEALEVFREDPDRFDMVITDMTMPKMTGDELGKELLLIRPDVPIVLCTGFSEKIDEERAKEIGIREFVLKPIIMSEIAQIIRKVLG